MRSLLYDSLSFISESLEFLTVEVGGRDMRETELGGWWKMLVGAI